MRIWVYTLCYNEEHFVGNFLEAYRDAEKIIVYDNQSTDRSVELLQKDPRVEIRINDSNNEIRDDIYLEIKNNAWKEARGIADWVIVVDFDEVFNRIPDIDIDNKMAKIVWVKDLNLKKIYDAGYTIIHPFGYDMISECAPLGSAKHPVELAFEGVRFVNNDKMCCFRPDKIDEINYTPGCHSANPTGEVNILRDPDYKMLHFKMWNLRLYLEKLLISRDRLSELNKAHGWGVHYTWTLENRFLDFLEKLRASQPLMDIPL